MTDPNATIGLQRRQLLKRAGVLGAGVLLAPLAACQPQQATPTAAPPTTAPGPATTAPTSPVPAAPTTAPAPTQAPATATAVEPARIAWITGVAEFAFVLLGAPQGQFDQVGIRPEFIGLNDGGTQLRAMLGNEVDFMIGGVGAVFAAQAQGASVKTIGSAYPKLNFVMYAKPGIESVEQLAGKTIGTASQGSFLHSIATALLDIHGVDLGSVQFVNIGSSPSVFQAVQAGVVDAGPSTIDFIPIAEESGNPVIIANFAQEMPDYFRVGVVAQQRDVQDRPDYVRRALEGIVRSHRFGLDNRDVFIRYGVEQMGKDQEQMEFLYDYEVQNRIVAPNAEIEQRWVEVTQQVNLDAGTQPRMLSFEETSDLRFQQQVIGTLGEYQWR